MSTAIALGTIIVFAFVAGTMMIYLGEVKQQRNGLATYVFCVVCLLILHFLP